MPSRAKARTNVASLGQTAVSRDTGNVGIAGSGATHAENVPTLTTQARQRVHWQHSKELNTRVKVKEKVEKEKAKVEKESGVKVLIITTVTTTIDPQVKVLVKA